MGLMNFWNKKTSDQIPVPSMAKLDISSDLPSIDGENLDASGSNTNFNSMPTFNQPVPTPPIPKFDTNSSFSQLSQISSNNANSLPTFDISTQTSQQATSVSAPISVPPPLGSSSQSLSINVPTLDFSMPPPDDAPLIIEPQKPLTVPVEEKKPDETTYLDAEDLKKLFLNDDEWKEPDWNNFEPYQEDKIDEPHLEDFGPTAADLPNFSEEEKISEPQPLEKQRVTTPMELFIRGREYAKAFLELDQITKSVNKIDSKVGSYEDILKREESLVLESKNQMEYMYKKLIQIDKKIFAE